MRPLAVLALLVGCAACAYAEPLVDYVNTPDTSFEWKVESSTPAAMGTTLVKLEMTSQVWQGIRWTHRLWMVVPKDVKKAQTAVVAITGGEPDASLVGIGSALATQSGSIVAVLGDIPNQPLFGGKSEDALIAYTFVKYLETGDATWPLLFPMAKAALRAMDAVQQYVSRELGGDVKSFITTGASKRGWTTWLTGAVDKRLVGIAPIVYDNLDLVAQMKQQREYYGGYSEQIREYTDYDLQAKLATREGAGLAAGVDPYTFRERLTMPKLILVGSNDPYWTLESANLYLPGLSGETSILYFPNGGHDLGGAQIAMPRLVPTMLAFLKHCSGQLGWPKQEWHWSQTGDRLILRCRSDMQPKKVSIWTATADTKDFRKSHWEAQAAKVAGSGGWSTWSYTVKRPASGYAAAFAEVEYSYQGQTAFLSTTPKMIGAR